MDNLPCNVVQDLLVLYDDHVCSEDSERLIQEHIKTCGTCRDTYEKTIKDLPEPTSFEEDMRKLKKALNKLSFCHSIRHFLIFGAALAALLFLFAIGYRYFDEHITSIPTSYIEVSELYRLKSGEIYFTLESDKDFAMTVASQILVPDEKRYENYEDGWCEVRLDHSFWRTKSEQRTQSFVYPLEEYQEWENDKAIVHKSKAIYYIGENDTDKLTIWKDGQDLAPAPDSIEQKVAEEKKCSNYSYHNFNFPMVL